MNDEPYVEPPKCAHGSTEAHPNIGPDVAGNCPGPLSDRPRMTHLLKTAPSPWMAVGAGIKTAEFRRNDRGFEVGDTLDLRCITEDGRSIVKVITHIIHGPQFGIPEGFAMLSFKP